MAINLLNALDTLFLVIKILNEIREAFLARCHLWPFHFTLFLGSDFGQKILLGGYPLPLLPVQLFSLFFPAEILNSLLEPFRLCRDAFFG